MPNDWTEKKRAHKIMRRYQLQPNRDKDSVEEMQVGIKVRNWEPQILFFEEMSIKNNITLSVVCPGMFGHSFPSLTFALFSPSLFPLTDL